jgi:hypothetical protein
MKDVGDGFFPVVSSFDSSRYLINKRFPGVRPFEKTLPSLCVFQAPFLPLRRKQPKLQSRIKSEKTSITDSPNLANKSLEASLFMTSGISGNKPSVNGQMGFY